MKDKIQINHNSETRKNPKKKGERDKNDGGWRSNYEKGNRYIRPVDVIIKRKKAKEGAKDKERKQSNTSDDKDPCSE